MAPASPRAIATAIAVAALGGAALLLWPTRQRHPAAPAAAATVHARDAPVAARERRPAAARAAPPPPAAPPTARDTVALALRSAAPTAEARRLAVLAALAASGPADPAREAAATARIAGWHATLDRDIAGAIELGAARCYRAGCAAELAFATADAYQMAQDHLRRQPATADDGGRMATPAIPRGDGWLVADWIALAPE
jgi:hypothetical protein